MCNKSRWKLHMLVYWTNLHSAETHWTKKFYAILPSVPKHVPLPRLVINPVEDQGLKELQTTFDTLLFATWLTYGRRSHWSRWCSWIKWPQLPERFVRLNMNGKDKPLHDPANWVLPFTFISLPKASTTQPSDCNDLMWTRLKVFEFCTRNEPTRGYLRGIMLEAEKRGFQIWR